MNANTEQPDFDARLNLAKEFTKTTPLIRVRRSGGVCLACVLWAKFDRIRISRWVAQTAVWARAETISWDNYAGRADDNGVMPKSVQMELAS